MQKVVGVRFKPAGKIYYFDPTNIYLKLEDNVIVETARGLEACRSRAGHHVHRQSIDRWIHDFIGSTDHQ